jgi:hypothetical protein
VHARMLCVIGMTRASSIIVSRLSSLAEFI